jgi:hypothetical protein
MCASLLGIAETFAQIDQRLAAIEAKLERLLAERPPQPTSRAEQLTALLDQRIKAALEREQHALCEATAAVVCDVLAEFIAEFRGVCSAIEAKLAHVETLLAQRPPLDPLSQRPN